MFFDIFLQYSCQVRRCVLLVHHQLIVRDDAAFPSTAEQQNKTLTNATIITSIQILVEVVHLYIYIYIFYIYITFIMVLHIGHRI